MILRALSHFLIFAVDLHPYYALSGLTLLAGILLIGYFKFRVKVAENGLLYYGSDRTPLKPGFHFMPYVHTAVDMKPRLITIGLDELQTTSRTDVYRQGGVGPSRESTVHRAPRHAKDGVIISWAPDERRLSDFLQSHVNVREQILAYLAVRPDARGVDAFIENQKLGVKILTIYDARVEKKKQDSVELADDVEIPYEG